MVGGMVGGCWAPRLLRRYTMPPITMTPTDPRSHRKAELLPENGVSIGMGVSSGLSVAVGVVNSKETSGGVGVGVMV